MVAPLERLKWITREFHALRAWWVSEISELWADLWARLAPNRAQRLVLWADAGRIRIWTAASKSRAEVLVVEPVRSGQWPEAPLSGEWARLRKARTVLLIPEQEALSHEIRVPAAAERSLAQVVTLAMEREMPLPLDQLATHWRVRRRDSSWLHIRISAVQQSRLQALHALAGRWGVRIVRSAVAPQDFDGVDLRSLQGDLAHPRRAGGAPPWSPSQKRLAIATAIAIIAATALTVGQWMYERNRLAEPLEAARAGTERLGTLRRQYNNEAAFATQVLQQLRREDAFHVLDQLSRAVDQGSWAHKVSIRNDTGDGYVIEMSSLTRDSPGLLQQLRQVPGFNTVQLLSSQPADRASGKQRVVVSLRWEKP